MSVCSSTAAACAVVVLPQWGRERHEGSHHQHVYQEMPLQHCAPVNEGRHKVSCSSSSSCCHFKLVTIARWPTACMHIHRLPPWTHAAQLMACTLHSPPPCHATVSPRYVLSNDKRLQRLRPFSHSPVTWFRNPYVHLILVRFTNPCVHSCTLQFYIRVAGRPAQGGGSGALTAVDRSQAVDVGRGRAGW